MRTFLLLLFLPCLAGAQQPFVEGVILYAVTLTPANGSESLGTHAGTYTITVKGDRIRRELRMAAGFQNVILIDGTAGTVFSLQATPDRKYAISLSAAAFREHAKSFENYTLKEAGKARDIAGGSCQPYTLRYPDGKEGSLCLSAEYIPQNASLHERFPGLQGIPLQFEYRSDDGSLHSFTAERVEATPVAEGAFRVPADYKIVSEAAYRDTSE